MKNQMLKYSLYDYIKEYKTHKDEIDAVIFNKSIEHYNNGDNGQILGMTMSIFIVAFLLSLGLWIAGLVLTIKHWNTLPSWAQIICVLGLLPIIPGGPIVTIVIALLAKK
jgi:hypothetical protein